MRRLSLILLAALAIGACGGSHHGQRLYHTKYGVQAHSPTFGLPPKGLQAPRVSSAPTVQMLDTVGVSAFSGLRISVAAGYTSGHWPTYFQLAGHYSRVIAVMVFQTHYGVRAATRSCLDREPGDAPASAAGPWARHELYVLHIEPCVYASLSDMSAVRSSLAGALGPSWRTHVLLWDADWTFFYHLDSGYDCTQWTDHYLSRNIDSSACTLAFANIGRPRPKPRPKPQPKTPVCFGRRAQLRNSTCERVRPLVAKQVRAAKATHKARIAVERGLGASHCRRPYRRSVCVQLGRTDRILLQRERWFIAAYGKELKQYG